MHLGSAIEHGGDQRNADASADIAGEVHQAGRGVVLISRKKCIGRRIDWNEEKSHAYGLKYTGSGCGAEIDSKSKPVMWKSEPESTTSPKKSSQRGL